MSDISESLVVRVQNSFAQLSAVATKLNNVSGELSKVVSELDTALQKLNLGISAWIDVSRETQGDGYYSLRKMGYARVGKQWGIALCVVNSHEFADVDERPDIWLFNDAPRWLRIEAVEKLPELFEKLAAEAITTTEKLVTKTSQARELASAVDLAIGLRVGDELRRIQHLATQVETAKKPPSKREAANATQAAGANLGDLMLGIQHPAALRSMYEAHRPTVLPPQPPTRKR